MSKVRELKWMLLLILLAGALVLGPQALAVTWDGSLRAHAEANDPPAPLVSPPDDTLTFTVSSGANQRQWVPNPPVSEANWNNDNWISGGNASWHRATSGATQAKSKAKAGLDGQDNVVVVARARVGDLNDGNLWNNGGDNAALATATAKMSLPYVSISGVGTDVDATLRTTAYMAQNPDGDPVMCSHDSALKLVVGQPFSIGYIAYAKAQHPTLGLVPISGVLVGYTLSINDQAEAGGEAVYLEGDSEPANSGAMTGASWVPWTCPGCDGEWYEDETGLPGYYGAIKQELILPDGYAWVPEPATLGLLALGGLALFRRKRT